MGGSFGRTCPDGLECIVTDFNPHEGLVSFDNIALALLTVFQAITEEGWSDTMYSLFDTTVDFVAIYFVLLILLGSYFMLNLIISALSVSYMKVRTESKRERELQIGQSHPVDQIVCLAEQKQECLERFLSLSLQNQVAQMEMRLAYSYELHQDEKCFSTVTKDEYEEYKKRNARDYPYFRVNLERSVKPKLDLERSTKFNSTRQVARDHRGSSADMFQDPSTSFYEVYKTEEQSTSAFYETEEPPPSVELKTKDSENSSSECEEGQKKPEVPQKRKTDLVPWGARENAPFYRAWIFHNIVDQMWFKLFVMFLIICNTGVLASEFFGQPEWMFEFQKYSNYAFLGLFTMEILLRVTAEGHKHYYSTWFNRFDVLIVFMGYVELLLDGNVASVFRLLRILRFMKLANYWPTFNNLLQSVDATMRKLLPFLVFFLLCLYIFTISGLHVLGSVLTIPQEITPQPFVYPADTIVTSPSPVPNVDFDCTTQAGNFQRELTNGSYTWHCPARTNYDSFLWSAVTSFQVITGEDWNGVMYLAVAQTGSWWPVFYFIFLVLFGTYIVLNFFLAILIDTFVEQHVQREEARGTDTITETLKNLALGSGKSLDADGSTGSLDVAAGSTRNLDTVEEGGTASHSRNQSHQSIEEIYKEEEEREKLQKLKEMVERRMTQAKMFDFSEEEMRQTDAFQSNSIFFIPPTSTLRLKVAIVVTKKWFEGFILLMIIFSCVLLALDRPVDPILSKSTSYSLNVFVTVVFVIEAGLKIFAFGFIRGKGSYLRNSWNILDFVIVIVSLVDIASPSTNTHGLQAFRAARALRPLRIIRAFEGLRIVVHSFGRALIPCFQVMLLCMIFYAVFSICALTFFSGQIHACYECPINATHVDQCVRNYTSGSRDCFPFPAYGATDCPTDRICQGLDVSRGIEYVWVNPTYGSLSILERDSMPYSFDNFGKAFQTLFEVSSMEIWMEPMYIATDIVGVGRNPVRGSSDGYSVFFVIFIFVLQFFMLQVFVAVLIDTYFDSADEVKGDAFMTSNQKRWVDSNKKALLRPFKPHYSLARPQNLIRRICYDIVMNPRFKVFIYCVIVLNTICYMGDHYSEEPDSVFFDVLNVLEFVFGAIYVTEACLKIIGLGPRKYFSRSSNWFDFIIVLAVIVGWIIFSLVQQDDPVYSVFKAIEALRVLRIMRLCQGVHALRPLVATLLQTFYPLLNILGLIMLIFFIYAILGMQLFGSIIPGEDMQYLNRYVNFNNFRHSFVTLFVMSTGESWNGIMHDLSFYSKNSRWFCLSFVVISQLFLLNLFVAVILANFNDQFEQASFGEVKRHIDENSLKGYNKVWNQIHMEYVSELRSLMFDTKYKHCSNPRQIRRHLQSALKNPSLLPATRFAKLLLRLKAPLGFRKRSTKAHFTYAHIAKYVKDKHIPISPNGMINFHSTLRALIDINVMEGRVPEDVQTFLNMKVSTAKQDESSFGSELTGIKVDMSMEDVLAWQQVSALMRTSTMHWRVRHMRKHGASDERIRQFVEEYEPDDRPQAVNDLAILQGSMLLEQFRENKCHARVTKEKVDPEEL
uniref:Ion transport domain-containing protein n=1 Tax=Mucochytrium quahogii TaxID=96639 RepID=A0A7S2SE50_9STRA